MSFSDVLQRGDDYLRETRSTSKLWNYLSQATCLSMVVTTKVILNVFYRPKVHNLNNLDDGLNKARSENRSFITVMNHMSSVDDPCIWGCLPFKYFMDIDDIRWGLAAANLCFASETASKFFTLGKILPCERFGRGPFQVGVDAAIRVLSPDNTLDLQWYPHQDVHQQQQQAHSSLLKVIKSLPFLHNSTDDQILPEVRKFFTQDYQSPILRKKTSWVHIFPEGYVCQLKPPHNNSMRFFRWGTARLILEPTVAPVVVPIFTDGFEKVMPEEVTDDVFGSVLPQNMGAEINVRIGKAIDDVIIEGFRTEWKELCDKFYDKLNPNDLSFELKFGKEAQNLRRKVCGFLREKVAELRLENGFPPEDKRFAQPEFWQAYTKSKGESDPDVKFQGKNWAVKEYQKGIKAYDQYGNIVVDVNPNDTKS